MLVSDFYIVTTTSRKGSKYDDFFSQSVGRKPLFWQLPSAKPFIVKSLDRPYPTCFEPTDDFYLPTVNTTLPLSFAYCRPSKYSTRTLGASGSILGLAPSEHLSQIRTPSLFKQLLEKEAIQRPIFSLMLINGQDGVLSVGGTAANAIDLVETQTKTELDSLASDTRPQEPPVTKLPDLVKRGRTGKGIITRQPDWEDDWAWSEVQGAEGWWQVLMHGVWVDGSKVLHNQAVVIDVHIHPLLSCPVTSANIPTDQ